MGTAGTLLCIEALKPLMELSTTNVDAKHINTYNNFKNETDT